MLTNNLYKTDGWINLLAGLGKKADKTKSTLFGDYPVLNPEELTRMWMGDGLGKKIVSAPADDMTRNWITVENDQDGKIENELQRLSAETKINEATKWSRLYNGSIIVVGVNDGRPLDQPLAVNSVKSIDWMKVYPSPRIPITTTDFNADPKSPYYEDIEVFTIQKINGVSIKVHHSRCLVFKGDPVPVTYQSVGYEYLYWGMSILQPIWERLRNIGAIETGIANLMMEVVVGVFKLSNLAEILSSNNTEAIYNRLEIINASKSLINAVLLGENESFDRNTASLAGIADVLDRFMMFLSAVSEIPVTRLFGRSPAGMNATGESDLTTYYDMIASKQNIWLKPPVQDLVNMINRYMKLDNPQVVFNSPWTPTEAELIGMREKQANTDDKYINNGVLSSDEVRANRFEGGYSFNTTVEGDAPAESPGME